MSINMKGIQPLRISIIVPILNVETVLRDTIKSIAKQTYPIEEIIFIDNHSSDGSLAIAYEFKREKRFTVRIVARDKTYSLSESYNIGAKLAKGDYIVTLHSDSKLESRFELSRLVEPFLHDSSIVSTAPNMIMPESAWLRYNFWEKCLFARDVEKIVPSGNGKFECYRRDAFLKMGGYNEKLGNTIGSEDSDMHFRLRKIGTIVLTKATVVHLHGFDPDYALRDWIARRRYLSIAYGRLLRSHGRELGWWSVAFLTKPILALTGLIALIQPVLLIPIILFPFLYMPKMFTDRSTKTDRRIILLPFLLIFFIYYETYWMLKSLLFMDEKGYN